MLIDTHSHIYSKEFNGEYSETVKRALDKGVEKIIFPNIDSSSIRLMLDLVEEFPDVCYPLIGVHPTSINEEYEEELELVNYWLGKRKFYGIGEIGIDLYWDKTFVDEQVFAFRHQLRLAKQHDLPIVIHSRESFDLVYAILKEEYTPEMKGIFHAFTGTLEQAQSILDLGFKIGVGGIVTFKNSGLDKVLADLDISNLVLETDSPYLAPTPMRGKRNETSYITYVAEKLAEIYGIPVSLVSEITSNNARELFQI